MTSIFRGARKTCSWAVSLMALADELRGDRYLVVAVLSFDDAVNSHVQGHHHRHSRRTAARLFDVCRARHSGGRPIASLGQCFWPGCFLIRCTPFDCRAPIRELVSDGYSAPTGAAGACFGHFTRLTPACATLRTSMLAVRVAASQLRFP
ncbi:hypothetical protein BDV96DRAFT_64252 [Lophiotrema nucula]|uniref:Uncharacterized protein n=1 Tax=Lophiotrema nucula TaxID=690887 RepID=A0A6A5Z6Y5_9PLEO|nr:hypothetical protein BDV96DRAFT_64252 [Lophiotrema nucula]